MERVPGSVPTNVVSSNCSSTNTSVLLSTPNTPGGPKLELRVSVSGKPAVPFSGTSIFQTSALVVSAATVPLQARFPAKGSLKQLVLSTSEAYREMGVRGGDPLTLLDKVEVMLFCRNCALAVKEFPALRVLAD